MSVRPAVEAARLLVVAAVAGAAVVLGVVAGFEAALPNRPPVAGAVVVVAPDVAVVAVAVVAGVCFVLKKRCK